MISQQVRFETWLEEVVDIFIASDRSMWSSDGNLTAVVDKVEAYDSSFCYRSDDYYYLYQGKEKMVAKAYFVEGMDDSFEIVSKADKAIVGDNYIWVPENTEYNIGDILHFSDGDFEVVGKVKGEMAYIDKSRVSISKLTCVSSTKVTSMRQVKELEKLDKQIAKILGVKYNSEKTGVWVGSSVLNNFNYLNVFVVLVNGICVLLLLVSIALIVLCLVNSVKINSEKDREFFGLLKSQGMDENGIMMYNFFQYIFYILIGIVISSVVSAIILHFALDKIMTILFNLIGAAGTQIVSGYCWWMPLASGLVMLAVCMLVAKIESSKMSKQDIALLLKGEI